jgi:DNA-binding transcriptional LysR family regulator
VSEEPYDVAICIGKARNEHLPARRLTDLPRGLYASSSYCRRKGVPQTAADLLQHDCLVLESQLNDGLWPFPAGGRGLAKPRMTTTDIIVAREMAVAGVGIAMLPHALCERELEAGRMVRLLPELRIPPVVIAALFPERRHMPLRIRAFIDLMAQAVRDNPAEAASLTDA